jgi:hypothetical protein
MKKILTCLLFISISLSAADQDKEPKNFRGIEWGTDLSRIENFILTNEELYKKLYEAYKIANGNTRNFGEFINSCDETTNAFLRDCVKRTFPYQNITDKMSIGISKIIDILYFTYKKRFYFVYITASGFSNYKSLRETFIESYGTGKALNTTDMSWKFENVNISLSYNEYNEKIEIKYIYNPVQKEKEADEKMKAIEGKKDL